MAIVSSNHKGSGIAAILIIIVFTSIAAAIFSLPTLVGISKAREWKEVPCEIVSSKVVEKRGVKNDSRSYRVEVKYRYEIDGKSYEGDRYNFSGISSAGQATKEQVVRSLPRGAKAVCYVNPAKPAESVMNRDPSWELWFLAGPVVGFLMLGGTLVSRRKSRNLAVKEQELGEFRSSNRTTMIVTWVVAVVFIAFTTGISIGLAKQLFKAFDMLSVFVVVFGLASVAILFAAIHATLRYLKFGESTFKATTFPVFIGGLLEGRIEPNKPERLYGIEKNFTLRLLSIRVTTTGSGKNQRQHEVVEWEAQQEVHSSDGTVPVSFGIPADARETRSSDEGDDYLWRLEAKSQRPGVDYLARFVIPVIKGAIPEEILLRREELPQRAPSDSVDNRPLENPQVKREEDRSGATVFIFPAVASWGLVIMMLVAGLLALTTLKPLLLDAFGTSGNRLFPSAILMVFGLGFLFSLGTALSLVYKPTRVVVDSTGITIMTRRLGIASTKRVGSDEIEAIRLKRGITVGKTTLQSIEIVCRDGREMIAGSNIKDRREAEWLAAEMSRLAGVPIHDQKVG